MYRLSSYSTLNKEVKLLKYFCINIYYLKYSILSFLLEIVYNPFTNNNRSNIINYITLKSNE
jgi:hypothetical protein